MNVELPLTLRTSQLCCWIPLAAVSAVPCLSPMLRKVKCSTCLNRLPSIWNRRKQLVYQCVESASSEPFNVSNRFCSITCICSSLWNYTWKNEQRCSHPLCSDVVYMLLWRPTYSFFVFEPFKARILMPGFYFCGAMLRVLDNTDVERLWKNPQGFWKMRNLPHQCLKEKCICSLFKGIHSKSFHAGDDNLASHIPPVLVI